MFWGSLVLASAEFLAVCSRWYLKPTLGLVDGIDTMHKFIAKEFGTEKVTVEKITQKAKFPASLFGVNLQSEDFST